MRGFSNSTFHVLAVFPRNNISDKVFIHSPLQTTNTTSSRLKRRNAAAVADSAYSSSSNDYENTEDVFDLNGPPAKKFVSSTDSLPSHVNDLASYAAMLASSSNNQSNNDQFLQSGLISLVNENPATHTLNSATFPLYSTTSAAQLALLAQKQQQRNAALAAQCLLPQHASLLLNQQLRATAFAQPSMLNAYACPNLVPQQNQLPATMLAAANPSLINPTSYYEGSPLIMNASSSQPQLMRMSNAASPECKVDTSLFYNVFVGDLAPEVKHDELKKAFEKVWALN
ncbi:hypothetical protein M3Y97_00827300 [Aphelenchoides bicaudatus]|nr:hypothetical protein M3Y97_00827300 [Aphelenchoides bicaudatus]